MTMTSEHSEALIDDVIALIDRHAEQTTAEVRQAILDGNVAQTDLAGELGEVVGMALIVLHRVLDGVSILSQVGENAEQLETTDIDDLVALIQMLALTTELARRSRETAGPLWDLVSRE